MRYCEVASTHAGHVFAEYLQRAVADADRERRELLEQLLAGRAARPRAAARRWRTATASPRTSRLLAVVAVPAGSRADAAAAGAAFARAALGATRTLVVERQGEIAAVAALAPGCGTRKVCDRVEALHARLREEGLPLALGVSTTAHGVAELPRAFAEARAALECVDGDGGVAALPLMSPLRYLTLSAPDTARRLVDPRLRTFLSRTGRAAAGCATRSACSPRPTSSSAWRPRACRCTRTRCSTACAGSRSAPAAIRAAWPTCSSSSRRSRSMMARFGAWSGVPPSRLMRARAARRARARARARTGARRARREGRRGRRPTSRASGPRRRKASRVWFTLRKAELTELYYPDLSHPSARSLEFMVDGKRVDQRARSRRTR